MPLRHMARRLRVPATAALQRASSPHVSPAAAPRLLASRSRQVRPLASRSPQIGEDNRAMKGIKDMDKLNKEIMSDLEKASKALKNLPKMCALSAGAAAMLASALVAYRLGAFNGNNKYRF